MNTHPALLACSAMLIFGGFFAWPIQRNRLADTERMVVRHEREIEILQRRVALLEGKANNLSSFETTTLGREFLRLRERVDSLSPRDGRPERDGKSVTPPAPPPETPPR